MCVWTEVLIQFKNRNNNNNGIFGLVENFKQGKEANENGRMLP
jgi:hypothetical protein